MNLTGRFTDQVQVLYALNYMYFYTSSQPANNVETTLFISTSGKQLILNVVSTSDSNVKTTLDFNVETTSDFHVETRSDFILKQHQISMLKQCQISNNVRNNVRFQGLNNVRLHNNYGNILNK